MEKPTGYRLLGPGQSIQYESTKFRPSLALVGVSRRTPSEIAFLGPVGMIRSPLELALSGPVGVFSMSGPPNLDYNWSRLEYQGKPIGNRLLGPGGNDHESAGDRPLGPGRSIQYESTEFRP